MKKKFREIFGKTDDTIRQYPLVLVMALLAATSLICMSESNLPKEKEFLFGKLSLVFSLGISLTFAFNILSQRIKKVFILQLSGILFLVFFYFLLPKKEVDFTEQSAFLIVPIFILSHLLVSFIAFFGNKKELNFWQYNKNLFINIFLTAVFTGVLIGGIQLAIVAVDQLFDFNFNSSYYRNPFIIFSVFGSCLIFLLFNVNGLQDLEKDSNFPQILKFFTQYILIPLLLIYAVILYFYAFKIVINWELPRGWVSYLVLAYSVVGIFALLLVHPLKAELSKSWVKIFSKIFYFTLVPLLILLFIAIFTRILQYGYTEPRYFVLILAIWLSAVVFYFILKKNPTIKFVPVSLFCAGLFALAFPYLNTFSVAKRSQKTELNKILVQNNLLENGKINFNKMVSDTVVTEISSKFEFLAKRKQKEYLLNILPKKDQQSFVKNFDKMNYWEVNNTIRGNFSKIKVTENNNLKNKRVEIHPSNNFQNINGYEYMADESYFNTDEGIKINNDIFKINTNYGNQKINFEIVLNNNERLNISDSIKQIADKYKDRFGTIEVPEISTEGDLGNYHVKIIFGNLILENYQRESISFNKVYILFRKK